MITLHGYWRSTASYRVRIALNLKQVDYRQVTHDLRANHHKLTAFLALQPQGMVPAIEVGEEVLIQSPAIIEWLDETYPTPAFLPEDLSDRAVVRAMAAIVGCDIHPLNNLRVLRALREMFGASEEACNEWIGKWIGKGFEALEVLIARHGRGFAFGDRPTVADIYLVPQVYSAQRFGVNLEAFPRLLAAVSTANALPAFADAAPGKQPDADPS